MFYPDEDGTVFSGSAIVDWKNVTGLKQNENDVILIYYTCAGSTSEASKGKPFTQNLAYSVDGGLTFKKYAHNPLIEQIVGGNRDPKVIYYEPDDSYIMAFYLDNHEYVLYKSTDLIHWSKIQSLYMEEDAECPDSFHWLWMAIMTTSNGYLLELRTDIISENLMEKAIRILVHSCGLTMEIIRMQHSRGQICRMDEEYELRFRQ